MNNKSLTSLLTQNAVTLLFVGLCIGAFFASGTSLSFLFTELATRMSRNTFMVLSLVIPVVAGLGLNFGIVLGAIATQIAIFLMVLFGFTGVPGLVFCVAVATPLAMFFGWLIGMMFNNMKGTEMIGGLMAGYFSDGLYQLLFLIILGGVIPISNSTLMISTGVGVKNTIDLKDNIKYALDDTAMISIIDLAFYITLAVSVMLVVYRLIKKQNLELKQIAKFFVPVAALYGLSFIPPVMKFLSSPRLLLLYAVEFAVYFTIAYNLFWLIWEHVKKIAGKKPLRRASYIVIALLVYGLTYVSEVYKALMAVRLPMMTYICIGGLCVLIPWFLNTKLGQEMRTVGQDRAVATSAGINVNRTRIIAMMMSTVLASYGHLISLQNIGTLATYGSHQTVGLYAIAALLVGGASVQRATTKQAVLGVVLFHSLFILSPIAGTQLLGNAQIGEYFRVFVAYGVIAVALAMHARQKVRSNKQKELAVTKPDAGAGAAAGKG